MPDVVVTCPAKLFDRWVAEGDLPGQEWSGYESFFSLGGRGLPRIIPGDRVYIVAKGRLRGYAPLVRIDRLRRGYALVRRGGAVAVTIDQPILGFRGFRYRFWSREIERAFPEWMQP